MNTIEIPHPVKDRGYCKGLWITTAPFMFRWRGLDWFIHDGFVSDYRSSPRPVWSILPPRSGWGDEAFLIHDFLRRFYGILGLTMRDTDQAMRDAMVYYNLRHVRLHYRFVRMAAALTDNGGAGKPGRAVRRAMDKRGDSWREYAERVRAWYE